MTLCQRHRTPLRNAEGSSFGKRFPAPRTFRQDVIAGLKAQPKRLPCKYLYDERGSELFELICELPEYYPTRTELAIMEENFPAMVALLGPCVELVELGSGNSRKTRLLLQHLENPTAYIPIDISEKHLLETARTLTADFPAIPILPLHADFSTDFSLPGRSPRTRRRVLYFPGSTIGNFAPEEARALLGHIALLAGEGGGLLIGVDTKKAVAILEAAYNDEAGVTADFNLNLLVRIRRELSVDIDPDQFEHHAFFNPGEGRVEMHLVSKTQQTIRIAGTRISFRPGESIHTENSYKYHPDEFRDLAARAGWRRVAIWSDADALFSVQYFIVDSRILRPSRRVSEFR